MASTGNKKTSLTAKKRAEIRETKSAVYYEALEFLTRKSPYIKDGLSYYGMCFAIEMGHIQVTGRWLCELERSYPEFMMFKPMETDPEYGNKFWLPADEKYLPYRELILMFCAEIALTNECNNLEYYDSPEL